MVDLNLLLEDTFSTVIERALRLYMAYANNEPFEPGMVSLEPVRKVAPARGQACPRHRPGQVASGLESAASQPRFAPDSSLAEYREMKVKIPMEQHLQLHTLKLLHGWSINDVVLTALRRYFAEMDAETNAAPNADPSSKAKAQKTQGQ